MPAGQSICPYHYEYPEEEWLIVLAGSVVVRHPGGEDELVAGDIVCFPSGPAGAHKVTNRGDETARVLMFSTVQTPAIAVTQQQDRGGHGQLRGRRGAERPRLDRACLGPKSPSVGA